MADNSDKEQPERPTITQPDDISEVINSANTEPVNSTQEAKNMEVHHHPDLHHKPRKWKEYFLEFLMIFLAVTLGFFAENIREHISDDRKGEQYIQSLTEDLEADTLRINDIIRFDEEKAAALSSMYQCYDTIGKNLKATTCMGVLVKYSKVNRPFQLNDRTIIQLASGAGYRLLKKQDADSILAYERLFKGYHDFESTVYQDAQDNVRNTLNDLADFKVLSPLQNVSYLTGSDTGSSTLEGPLLFSDDRTLVNKWFNQLQLYLRVTRAQKFQLSQLKAKASSLIAFYKNKYHLG